MKIFHTFIFERYHFDSSTLKAHFYYNFDNGSEVFEEIIDFSSDTFEIPDVAVLDNTLILNNFLFQLHLALGISYYKIFPTHTLEIQSGYLDDVQILFWSKFYRNGLGEFFITNNIDPKGLLHFTNTLSKSAPVDSMDLKNYIEKSEILSVGKNLLLWGGGKDSIVSYSLLKPTKKIDLFVFGKVDPIKKKTAEIVGEKIFLVKRQLSSHLFRMNKEGYYNGHVPITGIIAFSTFLASYLYGYSNIILSNEKSASENNTEWKGLSINHQYSKSGEFEEDIHQYLRSYISQNISYFSLLRGMYEYKIGEIFSRQRHFFKEFSSCNRNFTIDKKALDISHYEDGGRKKLWCCECEKCCFVFLILSAFLAENELIDIFGIHLFEKKELEDSFRELIGFKNYKPFECVGTYDESLLSAKKVIKRYKNGDLSHVDIPIVLKNIEADVYKKCDQIREKDLENQLLTIYDEDTLLPDFKQIVVDL